MKHLTIVSLFALVLLSACAFHPVMSQVDFDAMQTATAAVPPLPTMDDPTVPPTATVELVPTPSPAPTCLNVKGNIDANGRKLYHLPGMRNYNQVVIEESKGEKVFCSEQDAIDAGWTKAGN